jgi:protoporphyrinogen oxidase
MRGGYDVAVIGAGIGGLTAASILAGEGMDVVVIDREDRVGGRALSIQGEEISERGADWYRRILGRHYCYLAGSDPGIERVIADRMLDGYTIDLGYHGVPCAGKGYLGRLTEYLGIEVTVNPCDTALFYDGEFYREPAPGSTRLDDRIYRRCKEKGIRYWSFNTESFGMSPEELDELEKVSLYDYCDRLGLTEDDVVWQTYRCMGTLFTTINNPHDISAGEMVRYTNEVMMPVISAGDELHVGGFAVGGILNWSQKVAGRLLEEGGTLVLGAEVERVMVEDGGIKGVSVKMPDSEKLDLEAGTVISTVPVQETFDLVSEDCFEPGFVRRAKSLYGYGSLAPYFGLSRLPMPPEQANRLVKTPEVVPADGGFDYDVYMAWNVQSAVDPTCAPEGKHLLTAYLPLTDSESRDPEKVMKVQEAVPQFLERAYPGFMDCVDWALYPMCLRLEGVAKSISQAGTLKPEVSAPGLHGLFFAGDTARGFGVAMDCACSAGINCAAAVLGRTLGIE